VVNGRSGIRSVRHGVGRAQPSRIQDLDRLFASVALVASREKGTAVSGRLPAAWCQKQRSKQVGCVAGAAERKSAMAEEWSVVVNERRRTRKSVRRHIQRVGRM